MANEFWISDRQWALLEPLIPMNRRGVKPKRNREVISAIVHILKVGCRWRDCPEAWPAHHDLQSVQPLVEVWRLADDAGSVGGSGIDRSAEHRQHNRQGASLCRRR